MPRSNFRPTGRVSRGPVTRPRHLASPLGREALECPLVGNDPDMDTPMATVAPARELRRDYHDRVAAIRAESLAIVEQAVLATRYATTALLNTSAAPEELTAIEAATATAPVAQVEAEVMDLLALESPVARDLRIILTSRDIAQVGELCLGLCQTLARRARRAKEVLSGELRDMVADIGSQTADLLDRARGAWSGIDGDAATAVIDNARMPRQLLTRFFTELVSLREVPVAAAVDLGLAIRVYERLIDHAVDIAGRVLFAATGTPPVRASRSMEG
jgi:phosphate transport system protein